MNKLYFVFVCVFAFVLTSCDQVIDFKIDQPAESKLLVYAFPSDEDDYYVNVSMTMSVYGDLKPLDDVRVSCTTNGKADEVTLVNTEIHNGLPIAIYKAHGKHNCGDEINITVDCKGVPTATASTTIPKVTNFTLQDISETSFNNQHYMIFKIGFQDHPSTDYYAVRVLRFEESKELAEWYEGVKDQITGIYDDYNYMYWRHCYEFYHILTDHEPLLQNYLDDNLDSWDSVYRFMYIFNDKDIKTPDVTMRLYAEDCYNKDCTVQFFTLSEEYYKMLDRLNSQLNNDLGTSGLSQMYSTFNNVKGGFGCVAGYTCQRRVEGSCSSLLRKPAELERKG